MHFQVIQISETVIKILDWRMYNSDPSADFIDFIYYECRFFRFHRHRSKCFFSGIVIKVLDSRMYEIDQNAYHIFHKFCRF